MIVKLTRIKSIGLNCERDSGWWHLVELVEWLAAENPSQTFAVSVE